MASSALKTVSNVLAPTSKISESAFLTVNVTTILSKTVETVVQRLIQATVQGEAPIVMSTENIKITASKIRAKRKVFIDFAVSSETSRSSSFTIPPSVTSLPSRPDVLTVQMRSFRKNLYEYIDAGGSSLWGPIASMTIYDDAGNELPMTNLTEPIVIRIPNMVYKTKAINNWTVLAPTCSFWDVSKHRFSTTGCVLDTARSDRDSTVCLCSHLTDFSIIGQPQTCAERCNAHGQCTFFRNSAFCVCDNGYDGDTCGVMNVTSTAVEPPKQQQTVTIVLSVALSGVVVFVTWAVRKRRNRFVASSRQRSLFNSAAPFDMFEVDSVESPEALLEDELSQHDKDGDGEIISDLDMCEDLIDFSDPSVDLPGNHESATVSKDGLIPSRI
eukprot:GILJ01013536.1.p1 GENE.GILJ01013536.1~~GILJ01013536.1.p1  ORF type:complete len:421 (-),score=63.40 GILJ01013536.1:312-1469(-)